MQMHHIFIKLVAKTTAQAQWIFSKNICSVDYLKEEEKSIAKLSPVADYFL